MPRRSYHRSTPAPLPPPGFRIPVEGFIAGIFAGFFLATGIDADPTALLYRVLEITMEAIERINPDQDLSIYLQLFAFASFLMTVIALFEIVTQFDTWWVGAVLYAGGFLCGLLLIIAIF